MPTEHGSAPEESLEHQVARALDATFGEPPEPVEEAAGESPPELLETVELVRTNAIYGGSA